MKIALFTVTHSSPWRRNYSHEWQEPIFHKHCPPMFSPTFSKEDEVFTFQMTSFLFVSWILLALGQSHLAVPQHSCCHSLVCVRSEQKVPGAFRIIRIKLIFTPGNSPLVISAGRWVTRSSFCCCRKIPWHNFMTKWFGLLFYFLQAEIGQAVKKFTEREESKFKKKPWADKLMRMYETER